MTTGNLLQAIYKKPAATSYLRVKDWLLSFSLTSGIGQGCLLLPILFSTIVEVLVRAIRQEKEIKGMHIRKKDIKLSPFVDDKISCIYKILNYPLKN